ncbi:MAG: histidinol dehydrogenase [Desulfotomaculales bacterium]
MLRIMEATEENLKVLRVRRAPEPEGLAEKVREIINLVRTGGDEALCRLTARFDGVELTPERLRVSEEELVAAYRHVEADFLEAVRTARERIAAFHRRQLPSSWVTVDAHGMVLGQLVRPLERVGIYVPGGTARYPSTVLMTAVPAREAGVAEIVVVTPPGPQGEVPAATLVAAAEAGVTEVYRVGGAQAVAALAYGTETIRPVDKIVGPGNVYVTLAKQQVFGVVGIDMLAGPSEVVVVADSGADPACVAADLLAQAEHDALATAVLVTPDRGLAERVADEVERQLATLPRREIAAESLRGRGMALVTRTLEEAVAVADQLAPEHLELMVARPWEWLGRVRRAGAVFVGFDSPEALGDYLAGPSHVLPTGGSARFFSPLGVEDFLKRSSLIMGSREGLSALAPHVITLARVEGLEAHARAVIVRTRGDPSGEGRL